VAKRLCTPESERHVIEQSGPAADLRCAWTGCETTEGLIRHQWGSVEMADGEVVPVVSYYCPYHDVACFGTPEMQAEMGLWE
jgi:hypothetical protein